MRSSATATVTHAGAIPEAEVYPDTGESRVRQITWDYCGISRDAAGLNKAKQSLESVGYKKVFQPTREHYELRNIHAVALLIARCALAREESRGGHFRTDFPESRKEFQKHSHIDRDGEASFA